MSGVRSSATANNGGGSLHARHAACLNCRRTKIRCIRENGESKCTKCRQSDAECVIPEYRVGRRKGTKNKLHGVERALHSIEEAVKKSHAQGGERITRLQEVLHEARHIFPPASIPSELASSDERSHSALQEAENSTHSGHSDNEFGYDNYTLDDVENPLQLLARASDISSTQEQRLNPPVTASVTVGKQDQAHNSADFEDAYFGSLTPRLDIGPDLDPIELGLVTIEETDLLFKYFFESLSQFRWGLDSSLHTRDAVRRRSAFLLTSILAASALFLPSASALSKRLSSHCKFLVRSIIANRNRSSEIVLAFMINVPWMCPGSHWEDDETCFYVATALTIALDISLNKLSYLPSSEARFSSDVSRSQYITAGKALEIDGYDGVDPKSTLGKKLLRHRERVWIALFLLDRGVCLARGRDFTVPLTPLIETCDHWHISNMSDTWDSSIVSSAVLRRDFDRLISNVKEACDTDSRITVSSLQGTIEGFFKLWHATWDVTLGGGNGNPIPPYVEILVTHGMLSIYGSVVNHSTAPRHIKQYFRSTALSSALNVMRTVVQGEGRLQAMPNNTVIMILRDCASGGKLAPSIRTLIEQTANTLIRIGSDPPHRKGLSEIYGKHLLRILGMVRTRGGCSAAADLVVAQDTDSQGGTHPLPQVVTAPDFMEFSTMSDEQIIQAIDESSFELESTAPYLPVQGDGTFGWLDWFDMDIGV